MGLIESLKDAFDDVRTLHIHLTDLQLGALYHQLPANAKAFALRLHVPNRVLATWMDVFFKGTDYHYTYILTNDDTRRTIRERGDDGSLGYLLCVMVEYKDLAKMHAKNRMRVETVLRVDLKFRPLRECWHARGQPKPWKEGAVVEAATPSKPEAPTPPVAAAQRSASSTQSSAASRQQSAASTQQSASTRPTASTASARSKQTIRRKPVPPPAESSKSTAWSSLTVSAIASMATLRPEDSVSNAGRWVEATSSVVRPSTAATSSVAQPSTRATSRVAQSSTAGTSRIAQPSTVESEASTAFVIKLRRERGGMR
jgi:DNA polymerase III gamma/tau subunit